ncbi:hypothetical protein HELRODRAFT_176768 [Helobdella robusta]|uniref:Neurotransmitter-gated ion-channel ligand-binding domain-containing protein n=1 Tax=Helobdella robusta TaxID=6412 RepID=T1FAW2_HELRO|nr:hypothetical protein HELRODRAFT_176768 [Helobdella robusta]ESN99603.1 hypothetical protein HELRODRAFT_176768 [Helobdella robusta]
MINSSNKVEDINKLFNIHNSANNINNNNNNISATTTINNNNNSDDDFDSNSTDLDLSFKPQDLTSAVRSLDAALKAHLITMCEWYASQNNINLDDSLNNSSNNKLPSSNSSVKGSNKINGKNIEVNFSRFSNHQHPEIQRKDSSKSSIELTLQQQQLQNNNNNISGSSERNNDKNIMEEDIMEDPSFGLTPQYGSRSRMRRNTRSSVGFVEIPNGKFKERSSEKVSCKNIDFSSYWNPRLFVENIIGDPKVSVTYNVTFDRDHLATVVEIRRVNGSFFEFMELNQFPFDYQDLTVTVVSELSVDMIDLSLDQLEKCGINAQAFSAEQEWSLEQNVSTWRRTVSKTINKVLVDFPGLSVAAKASRRPQFFIWNIIVIMMAICSLAFATFTVSLETPHFRLQLTYLLLLTTVTFKFVVNKSLPKISYLTYLDKYILGSMVILCCICIWHALVGSVIYPNLPKGNANNNNNITNCIYVQPLTTASQNATVAAVTATKTTTDSSMVNVASKTTILQSVDHFSVDENRSSQNCITTAAAVTTTAAPPNSNSSDYDGDNNYNNNNVATKCLSTRPPGATCIMIDRIALGILSSVYIFFHLIFVILIWRSRRDEDEATNAGQGCDNEDMSTSSDADSRNGIRINVDPATQTSI